MQDMRTRKLAVIGLGYVGLPLAVAFGTIRETLGYDVDAERIEDLQAGHDRTGEVPDEDLHSASNLTLTADPEDLRTRDTYIITVPTPIDRHKRPDLTPLVSASETVGRVLKPGDLVIYESTVYPGATEEDCVKVLEAASGLRFNEDFFVGYSPERINPGDTQHRLADIVKVTSGSTPEIADLVDRLYQQIIRAGTHKAPSIRVAEAAKVIENTQRDLNVALMNELAVMFNKMGIDTKAVLDASGTKWNFLPFRPGLVGGHCIGVDPYYLTHKAEEIGHHPEVILAGRRINDGMGAYVANRTIKAMLGRGIDINRSRILVLGLTFKENCPDIRNTRVVDVIAELKDFGVDVDVHDPWVNSTEALEEYGLDLIDEPGSGYDAVILAVAHSTFKEKGAAAIRGYGHNSSVFFDLKSVFDVSEADLRL